MNFHPEYKQFEIKHEEDPLSIADIKTELEDIKPDIRTEEKEHDNLYENIRIKDEIESFPDHVSHKKTVSKVEGREERFDNFLEDHEDKQDKNRIIGKEEINFVPIVTESSATNRSQLMKDKCDFRVWDNVDEKGQIHDDLFFGKNNLNISSKASKVFKCHLCNKPFNRKNSLNKHMVVHTGAKPFTCDICSKAFSDRSTLNRHSRIHNGDKPFTCDFCNVSFSQKPHLTTHLRTHTNERPFACKICHKSFFINSHVNQHMRIHTGEKPFECNFCNKTFTYKSHIIKHLHNDANKLYKCAICSMSFSQKCQYSKHFNMHVGPKPQK